MVSNSQKIKHMENTFDIVVSIKQMDDTFVKQEHQLMKRMELSEHCSVEYIIIHQNFYIEITVWEQKLSSWIAYTTICIEKCQKQLNAMEFNSHFELIKKLANEQIDWGFHFFEIEKKYWIITSFKTSNKKNVKRPIFWLFMN